MPDISMCENKDCDKRTNCYRFMATPNPYGQSYMAFLPDEKGACEYFWQQEEVVGERECKTHECVDRVAINEEKGER